jgi:hypothetical protein
MSFSVIRYEQFSSRVVKAGMNITRGKVGKFDWFSRPRATELITVPSAQGMEK